MNSTEWTSVGVWEKYVEESGLDACGISLSDPQTLLIPDIAGCVPVADYNIKISNAINCYQEQERCNTTKQNASVLSLNKVRWDWVLCYGDGNFVDFDSMKGQTSVLNGANASGKSSFLDVICIGLFGEPTSVRQMQGGLKSKRFAKLVNDQLPVSAMMSISILFTLNGALYEISRTYNPKDKTKTACVRMLSADAPNHVHVEGLTAVDAWIASNLATDVEDLLMTNIVGQIHLDTDNFLYIKQEQQKAILDRVLCLDAVTAFGKIIKESHTAHTQLLNTLRTSLAAIEGSISTDYDATSASDSVKKLTEQTLALRQAIDAINVRREYLLTKVGNGSRSEDGDSTTYPYDSLASIKKRLTKHQKTLDTFSDLTNDDKEKALLVKGEHYSRWQALQDKHAIIGDPMTGLDVSDLEAHISALRARALELVENKPIPSMSAELLKRKQSEYEAWTSAQPPRYLDDPDELEVYRSQMADDIQLYTNKLNSLYENVPLKPISVVTATAESDSESLQPATRKIVARCQAVYETAHATVQAAERAVSECQQNIPHRISYEQWLKEYEAWYVQMKDIIEGEGEGTETVDELQTRYEQYTKYIETIATKRDAATTLEEQIRELNAELSAMDSVPFNADCWACQKQPMRIRQVQLSEKSAALRKSLTKVAKYLASAGDIDLRLKKQEAKAIKSMIERRALYDATFERKAEEKEAWNMYHSASKELEVAKKLARVARHKADAVAGLYYDKWHKKTRELRTDLAAMEKEHADIKRFLSELPGYVRLRDLIKDEQAVRDRLSSWEEMYDSLQADIHEHELDLDRIVLADEMEELKGGMEINTELAERLKAWDACVAEKTHLEQLAAYSECTDLTKQVDELNREYIDKRSRLVSTERALSDNASISSTRQAYVSAIKSVSLRKDTLAALEAKFVGDRSTSDGFKEYIYQNHIIPTFESTINDFLTQALSLTHAHKDQCDDAEHFRVRIGYQAKTFTYTLEHRGNAPMFDMISGYQKFMVSLAVRAALAKMNAVGHTFKHLFIDEGFVACDADNLSKAGDVLRALREFMGYHSIVLMSHSDAIKQCADNMIPITVSRDPDTGIIASTLRWGAAYPASPPPLLKKRGKSKKKVDE